MDGKLADATTIRLASGDAVIFNGQRLPHSVPAVYDVRAVRSLWYSRCTCEYDALATLAGCSKLVVIMPASLRGEACQHSAAALRSCVHVRQFLKVNLVNENLYIFVKNSNSNEYARRKHLCKGQQARV